MLLAATRLSQWVIAKRRFRDRRFDFDGVSYRYFAALYNVTFLNERAVELPIASSFVQRFAPEEVLEVGNVLGRYRRVRHTVVDKNERRRGVINQDIEHFAPGRRYRAIVSVSTLEHVGWDDTPRDPEKVLRALHHLRALLAPGGALLATLPLGYNRFVDAHLTELPFDRLRFMARTSRDNAWIEASHETVRNAEYGRPHRNANAIAVGLIGT